MSSTGINDRDPQAVTLVDVALIVRVRPAALVATLRAAGYGYSRPLDSLSFVQADEILQRFESGALTRPRRRDSIGAAISDAQNRSLHAQAAHEATLTTAKSGQRKRKTRAEKEAQEAQRVEEQRARHKARAAELRSRPPIWEESFAERKTNAPSSRPAAGYRAPKDGIRSVLSAGAPGLGRRA